MSGNPFTQKVLIGRIDRKLQRIGSGRRGCLDPLGTKESKVSRIRQCLAAFVLAGLLPAAAQAANGSDHGFYVGAKLGSASIDDRFFDDETAASLGVYLGWQVSAHLAFEGEYTSFGDFDGVVDRGQDPSIAFSAEPGTFGVVAVFSLPIGEFFSLFADAGFHTWDFYDGDGDSVPSVTLGDGSGTDPTYGIGGRFDLGENWSIRARYQRYEFGDLDLDELSLSGHYRFR